MSTFGPSRQSRDDASPRTSNSEESDKPSSRHHRQHDWHRLPLGKGSRIRRNPDRERPETVSLRPPCQLFALQASLRPTSQIYGAAPLIEDETLARELAQLIGLGFPRSRCPFHEDQNPSGSFTSRGKHGDWIFRCHACHETYSLVGLWLHAAHDVDPGSVSSREFVAWVRRLAIETGRAIEPEALPDLPSGFPASVGATGMASACSCAVIGRSARLTGRFSRMTSRRSGAVCLDRRPRTLAQHSCGLVGSKRHEIT
jgi:hypothetical protein